MTIFLLQRYYKFLIYTNNSSKKITLFFQALKSLYDDLCILIKYSYIRNFRIKISAVSSPLISKLQLAPRASSKLKIAKKSLFSCTSANFVVPLHHILEGNIRMKTGKFTYGNYTLSYATASESLLAPLTPPCKHSYNQIVSRRNTVQSHILALPLGILCLVRNAFFRANS